MDRTTDFWMSLSLQWGKLACVGSQVLGLLLEHEVGRSVLHRM